MVLSTSNLAYSFLAVVKLWPFTHIEIYILLPICCRSMVCLIPVEGEEFFREKDSYYSAQQSIVCLCLTGVPWKSELVLLG